MGAHRIIGSGGQNPFQVRECTECDCKDFENPDVHEYPGVEAPKKKKTKGGKNR
jgi:hypothetical protein